MKTFLIPFTTIIGALLILYFSLRSLTICAQSSQGQTNKSNFNGGFQKGKRTFSIGYCYGTYSLHFQNIWDELDNLLLFGPMYLKLEFGRIKHNGFAINGSSSKTAMMVREESPFPSELWIFPSED